MMNFSMLQVDAEFGIFILLWLASQGSLSYTGSFHFFFIRTNTDMSKIYTSIIEGV